MAEERLVNIPDRVIVRLIELLTLGAEAFMDRDWNYYPDAERIKAEDFVSQEFIATVRLLQSLRDHAK